MTQKLRAKFSYANVMATIAVFLVLGGGAAVAAGGLAKNSVGPNQLKKNAVTTAKIKNNAVTGGKIKESSLGAVPNASKLGGTAASGFLKTDGVQAFGQVETSSIDNFTSPTFIPVISKAFNAPSNGFLLLIGSVTVADDQTLVGANEAYFRLRLDNTPVTTDDYYHGISGGNPGEELANTGAATAVIPVTAGAHTAFIDAREEGTGSFFFGRDLSVLFVPGGSGVNIPVP